MHTKKRLARRSWKHLTEIDVLKIVTIIEAWPMPTITWEALVKEVEIQLGQLFSRQALERKASIKSAFQTRKGQKPELIRMSEAEQTIQRLRQRNDELEGLVRLYDLRFMRHVANARKWGKNPKDLDRPLDMESQP